MRGGVAFLGVILLVVSAGCVGSPVSFPLGGSSSDAQAPPTPSNWSSSDGPLNADMTTNQFRNLSIGGPADLPDQHDRHVYSIKNNGSNARVIDVVMWRGTEVVLNRSIEFPPGGILAVDVYKPGEYTVVLDPPNGSRAVYRPPDDEFGDWDCNRKQFALVIQQNGQFRWSGIQTLLDCP